MKPAEALHAREQPPKQHLAVEPPQSQGRSCPIRTKPQLAQHYSLLAKPTCSPPGSR